MIIRKGTKEDVSSILSLIKELAVFEKEPDAVIVSEADLLRDGFSENPLYYTFIAEEDGEVIGYMIACPYTLDWLPMAVCDERGSPELRNSFAFSTARS